MKLLRVIFAGGIIVAAVLVGAAPTSANTQNFSFNRFEASYYLSKDNAGRSTLRVDEIVMAQFPNFDQNKGIVRSIPLTYDGHSVSLDFNRSSLTRNGQPEPVYETYRENGNFVFSTGTDAYVRNAQDYRFSYTLRDVTKDLGDHQEFYWDTNGTDWRQPFGAVVAKVYLDPSIASAWTGEADCYQGATGSNRVCTVTKAKEGDHDVLIFSSNGSLPRGHNVTLAMGFHPGTFAAYQMGVGDYAVMALKGLAVLLGVGSLLWAIVLAITRGRHAKGRGTIVPQYLPPKDTSVMVAASVIPRHTKNALPAQLIDLAVRHFIQVIEYDKKGFFGSKKQYRLKLLRIEGLDADETAVLKSLFPDITVGAEYDMGDAAASQLANFALSKMARERLLVWTATYGLRRKVPGKWWPLLTAFIGLILSMIVLTFQTTESLVEVFLLVGSVFSFVITISILGSINPLSEKGVELRDYLLGLKRYISVAEEERLKILQSVEGADKTPIDSTDQAQLVRLYERVLPYAVLFGQEKSWAQVLEHYTPAGTTPDWYYGSAAFSASAFVSSFTSASSSSFPSSSGSGGVGGGGSSGGGGGGGGGGGR